MTEQQATREEMEQALAKQFGYDDYETFKREAEGQLGKSVLRQLEKKLAQYPSGKPTDTNR